jgi:hypothetical protein
MKDEMGRPCSTHGTAKKRPLGRHGGRWEDNIEKYGGNLWIGFIWLRIGTSSEPL